MLAFTNKEMKQFMEEVRLKTDPNQYDKMFGFGFNGKEEIRQTRGYKEERDMTKYPIGRQTAFELSAFSQRAFRSTEKGKQNPAL